MFPAVSCDSLKRLNKKKNEREEREEEKGKKNQKWKMNTTRKKERERERKKDRPFEPMYLSYSSAATCTISESHRRMGCCESKTIEGE